MSTHVPIHAPYVVTVSRFPTSVPVRHTDPVCPTILRFISRANPRDNARHVILGSISTRPTDFASQLNVSLANGWGIVRTVTDMCMKQPDGKYVLIKDPNKVSCSPDARPLASAACITTPAAGPSLSFVASRTTGFPYPWKPIYQQWARVMLPRMLCF